MTEKSWFWGGTVTGDHGSYTDDEFSDAFSRVFQLDRSTQGPLRGVLNELAVSFVSALTISVNTGWAIVDGKFYRNDGAVQFINAPPGALRYYRVVLQKDFALQTVRLAVNGPSVTSPIALTQNDGTMWEVPLASFSISAGNVMSAITDERVYCVFAGDMSASAIPALAITNAMIANDTITAAKIANRTRKFLVMPDFNLGFITGTTPLAKSSGGLGWMTSEVNQSYFYGSFRVPDDYLSGLKIYALYCNYDPGVNDVVVLTLETRGRAIIALTDAEVLNTLTNNITTILPDSFTLDIFVSPAGLAVNDLVEMITWRDPTNINDVGGIAFGAQFKGFLVEYVADM